jgi:hypothetical protein
MHYLKANGEAREVVVGWYHKYGTETLSKAWEIIQATQTSADTNPETMAPKPHGKNYRLAQFCLGELHGQNDPHSLCRLLETADARRRPALIEVRPPADEPADPVVIPFVPRIKRRDRHLKRAA